MKYIKKINESYQGDTPIATSITSSSTNEEVAGAKAVYDNSLEVYSTTEQRVGTWIDGKPLYRKCYQLTNLPTANNYTDTTTDFTMNDIFPVKLETTFKADWGAYFSCYSGSSNTYISSSLAVNDVQTNPIQIRIRSSIDIHTYIGYAILTYTKTTDSAS